MNNAVERYDVFRAYLNTVRDIPLLTAEEETELARRWRDDGDEKAARELVIHNLRFVVKVAYQYRGYRMRLSDLVQEGNMGLMKAVERFDPGRGNRLITYAIWWIRAYIQAHILRAWSVVRFGTTRAQRRLLFGLSKARREIRHLSDGDPERELDLLADRLGTTRKEVDDTIRRISNRDVTLDAPAGDNDERSPLVERLEDDGTFADEDLDRERIRRMVSTRLEEIMPGLNEREQFILERRLMSDEPMLLREIADVFGVSRERVRQVESALKDKLRDRFADLDRDGLAANLSEPSAQA